MMDTIIVVLAAFGALCFIVLMFFMPVVLVCGL